MIRLLSFLLLFLSATPAKAWWDYGHEAIATVAWDHIKPATRAKIRILITQNRALDTPTCPIKSIEDASVWPDCIKGLGPRFDYAFSWHYQNVDICKPFDLTAACKDGHCVSRQIDRQVKLLKSDEVPPREKLMALAFLTHFVGDLHMPLHAGDRSDRGGNDVKAAYGLVEGRVNLHSLWDGPLAERAITTPPAGPKGLVSGINAGERFQLAAGTPFDWSRESWDVARTMAYAKALDGAPCGDVPSRAKVDDAEIDALIPIAREQIARAGLRLARLLDESL